MVERQRGLAGLLAAAAAVILVAATAGFAWVLLAGGDGWPERVPALSAADLTEEPTDVWLTNGGSLFNQRYSPLDEIDTSNVKNLKGVWMTDLESGTAAKYSA
jgi:glucose dehydrogenase